MLINTCYQNKEIITIVITEIEKNRKIIYRKNKFPKKINNIIIKKLNMHTLKTLTIFADGDGGDRECSS